MKSKINHDPPVTDEGQDDAAQAAVVTGEFSTPNPSSGTGPRSDASGSRSPATLEFALLRGALEEIPFGVATTRGDTLLYANDALTRLLGAPSGGLEKKHVADLFAHGVFDEISRFLAEARVYDGRVRARAFDGRELDVEVHIEQYSSEAQGTGGFLIVRDVSLEVGALGRLVEQLAGALFRLRVDTGAVEMVSPSIARLTGIDMGRCMSRPVLLTTLLSGEERERLLFLYRRMVKGELLSANAQVNLRRADGTTRLLQIRASARRDTSGVVRHIDGILIESSRDPDVTLSSEGRTGTDSRESRDQGQTARATLDLTYEVLREGSQHLNHLFREIRSLRAAIKAHALPQEVAMELGHRLDTLSQAAGAAGALNRAARHALAGASLGATVGEVLDGVRSNLGPTIGESAVTVDAGDAAGMVIPENVDGLTLALTHLSLRAFRFAGSGSVHLAARRAAGTETSPRRPPREHVLIEILGIAPPDLADAAMEISSDVLRTVQRPDEADVAHRAAQALIGAAGGTIEADDATFAAARSLIRLKLP